MSSIKVQTLYNPSSSTETLQLNSDGTSTIAATSKGTVRTMAAGSGGWNLATGNFWSITSSIAVPTPTNAAAGTSGIIYFSANPASWPTQTKFIGGSPFTVTTTPAMCSFYVQDSSNILIGPLNEGFS